MNNAELARAIKSIRSRALIELVTDANRLGWRAQLSQSGVLMVHSPVGSQSISIPRGENNVRDRVLKSWQRKIIRYADPEKVTDDDRRFMEVTPPDDDEAMVTPTALDGITKHEQPSPTRWSEEKNAFVNAAGEPDPPIYDSDGPVTPAVQDEPAAEGRMCTVCDPPTGPWVGRAYAGHMSKHTEKLRKISPVFSRNKRRKVQCPYCEEWFKNSYSKGQHVRYDHPERKLVTETPGSDLSAALEMVLEVAQEALGISTEDPEKDALVEQLTKERDEALAEVKAMKEALAPFRKLLSS